MGNRHFDIRINSLIPCAGVSKDISSSDASSFGSESSSSKARSDPESNFDPGKIKFSLLIITKNLLLPSH